ncbi:MAG: hypothetical protein HY403_03070 [Elusimicrobia bacterium]|nr:hypothetical protein [Elusimicrobiota bacterium]
MNTKMTAFASLALLFACSASAQVTAILPGGRGGMNIGMPLPLPGMTPNISITPRVAMPAPSLAPSIALTLAPVPTAAGIPVLPAAIPLPERPAAPAADASSKDAVDARQKLDDLFDGRKQPSEAVRSGRHMSLPEHDLESEIGAR